MSHARSASRCGKTVTRSSSVQMTMMTTDTEPANMSKQTAAQNVSTQKSDKCSMKLICLCVYTDVSRQLMLFPGQIGPKRVQTGQ